jgi:hypothetical protein
MNCPVVHDFDPLAPLDPEAARILLAGGHKPQLALEALTRRFPGHASRERHASSRRPASRYASAISERT